MRDPNSVYVVIREGLQRLEGTPIGFDYREISYPTDSQVVRELVIGRRLLVKTIGQDLGFRLESWLAFFQSNPQWGFADELNDSEIWEHFVAPSITHQNSAKFSKFLEQAEIAWASGQDSDVTYEFLITRLDENRSRMQKIVVMERFFSSWKKTSRKVSAPRWSLSSETVIGLLGLAVPTFFIYGAFCSSADGYELLGMILHTAAGLCAGIVWWMMHRVQKEAETKEAAKRYVSDDRVY